MARATEILRSEQRHGSWGLPYNAEPRAWPWGNPVIGLRNPFAPPLEIEHSDEGAAVAHFRFTAVHEGQPGMAHGGASAMILDQVMGEVASERAKLMMTGTLTFTYRRPTPLGDLTVRAWVERSEGRKRWVKGELIGPEGVTVEAEGVFIEPKDVLDLFSRD
jgi:acyl-coenzyme A thioesterase PaaI-like protein